MKKISLIIILIFVQITHFDLLAQTYTPSQSSNYGSNCAGTYANMMDGSLTTGPGTNGGPNEWIKADFGSAQTVTAVTVGGGNLGAPCNWGPIASYLNSGSVVIQSSTNNSTWTTQATVGGVTDAGTTTFSFASVTAQYWRLYAPTGWLATSEFTFTFGAPPSPMAYSSSTATQNNTSNTSKGLTDQEIIGIQIVTTGSTSPLSATSFTFNTAGSTNPAADITNAKVFSTGTVSTFGTTTQFGSTYANPNGTFTITGSQVLSTGTNYFWLTYDIASGATLNNVVDAQFTSLTVGSAYTPSVTAPAGSRTIATLPVALMAAGGNHTLAVCSDGTVRAWGWDGNGQLGDNATLLEKYTPVQVSGLTGITAVAAGYQHSLALKNDGTVWAWGNNGNGQLGDGTIIDKSTPVAVNLTSLGARTVTAIAAGNWHSIALCSDGTVWAWGYGSSGQLGDGFGVDRLTPVQASGITGVTAIAGGRQHSLALKNDNTVWSWGWNQRGQLGDNTTTDRWTPTQVHGLANVGFLTGITAIGAGDWHSLAVKSDGTAWAWGQNSVGEIGDGTSGSPANDKWTPVQVSGLTNAAKVAGGNGHSFALKTDGTVWAWGYNLSGQLGDNTTVDKTTPVQVHGTGNIGFLTGITLIAGSRGQFHSMSLKSDGTVWGWGYDIWGHLGDNNTSPKYTPVQPIGLCVVAVLPVDVISFDVNCTENKNIRVAWATGSEMNNDYFTVEKSTDGKIFETVGTMQGAGNSSVTQHYEFVDESQTPNSTTQLYYRLKQTDYDGKFEYKQPIVSMATHCIDAQNQLIIYPNPVGDELSFQFLSGEQNDITMEVYDVYGKLMVVKPSAVSKGRNLFSFEFQDMSKGIYMLSVKTKSSAAHQKFIKQ